MSSNVYYTALWKPDCLANGKWAPKQCKGEATNGRCFCFDAVGNRIFGQAWIENADDMTCGEFEPRPSWANKISSVQIPLRNFF